MAFHYDTTISALPPAWLPQWFIVHFIRYAIQCCRQTLLNLLLIRYAHRTQIN